MRSDRIRVLSHGQGMETMKIGNKNAIDYTVGKLHLLTYSNKVYILFLSVIYNLVYIEP